MGHDGSGAFFVFFSKVVGFWNDGFFVSSTAPVELLFVGCLIIDEEFSVN